MRLKDHFDLQAIAERLTYEQVKLSEIAERTKNENALVILGSVSRELGRLRRSLESVSTIEDPELVLRLSMDSLPKLPKRERAEVYPFPFHNNNAG